VDYKQLNLLPLLPEIFEEQVTSDSDGYEVFSSNGNGIYVGKDLGTFKDSLCVPVHRWFRYPAGYSYKFVEASFDTFGIKPGDWVYDPFSGSGTTLLTAKQQGVNGYGVEAHSFVHWVADVKLRWAYDIKQLEWNVENLLVEWRNSIPHQIETLDVEGVFPALVYKCYHPQDLKVLYLLRECISKETPPEIVDLFKLALTDTLRGAAAAGTGWPYIAPRKNDGNSPPKKAFRVFEKTLRQMVSDLREVLRDLSSCDIHNVLGDSRERQNLPDGQINIALTSPPYLNNYDYADRTRLETYFWGITNSWGDITAKFRKKLITAATTQVTRSEYPDLLAVLTPEIKDATPHIYTKLQDAIFKLSELRLQKGGKKDYDVMVALYFNDIFRVMQETFRLLKPGARFCLVLGDSAPYGIHIPTDQVIGELGLGLGFQDYTTHDLRKRGDKWKGNPQRHKIPLKECVVILKK